MKFEDIAELGCTLVMVVGIVLVGCILYFGRDIFFGIGFH